MNKAILIVDDDSRNIFALSAVLKAKGFKILSANDVSEALDLLQTNTDVGIILLDMMMPDMDGYEAIPMIKAKKEWQHIPVIAVTAQAMAGDREKCIAAGADDYISKPVDVDRLVELLNERLR